MVLLSTLDLRRTWSVSKLSEDHDVACPWHIMACIYCSGSIWTFGLVATFPVCPSCHTMATLACPTTSQAMICCRGCSRQKAGPQRDKLTAKAEVQGTALQTSRQLASSACWGLRRWQASPGGPWWTGEGIPHVSKPCPSGGTAHTSTLILLPSSSLVSSFSCGFLHGMTYSQLQLNAITKPYCCSVCKHTLCSDIWPGGSSQFCDAGNR